MTLKNRSAQVNFQLMSVAEIKRAVDELSAQERFDLAEYLRKSSKEHDPQLTA
jgi:cytochrome c